MKKGLLIIAVILTLLLLLMAGGAVDSVKRGAGFLFIPSFTPTSTNTMTPSATLTNTATQEPTATATVTFTVTVTASMTPEPSATMTPEPTSTSTPLPTFDETAFAQRFYAEVTASAEAYLLMQTPSVTPTIPAVDLYTGLRMTGLTDGKELVFVRSDSAKDTVGFWIARNEVTNAEYRSCVYAGVCSEPMSNRCAGERSYYEDEAYNDYPVVNITEKQASDYCFWAGMRLLSLKDWQSAVEALGDEGVNYDRIYDQPLNCSAEETHLIGNVWEWTADRDSSGRGIIAGGSWKTSLPDIRGNRIGKMAPNGFAEDLGFRCVFDVR